MAGRRAVASVLIDAQRLVVSLGGCPRLSLISVTLFPCSARNSSLSAAPLSSGSGGGLFLSQSVVSSQSRTNCLSNDAG
jgi:hypothetical protein